MEALKKEAIHSIEQLPDDASMEDIMYRLYVLDKVRKGRQAAKEGKTISQDDLQQEVNQW